MKSSTKTTALTPVFFNWPAPDVARALLGKILVRRSGRTVMRAVIHKTEAYDGEEDLAYDASDDGRNRYIEAAKAAMLKNYAPMSRIVEDALIASRPS